MLPDRAVDWIQQIKQYDSGKIGTVIITGGEPFYCPSLLKTVLKTVKSQGLISVVVTNAFWAGSVKAAVETLAQYPEIDMLTISTDSYHRRFISAKKIRNAMAAADKRNIPFNLSITVKSRHDLLESLSEFDGAVALDRMHITTVLPAGRGGALPDDTFALSEMADAGRLCSGADFPIIFPDGRVISCMGIVEIPSGEHPLQPGNASRSPLHEILRTARNNTFLHAMRCLGPAAVIDRTVKTASEKELLGRYGRFGSCSLCYAIAGEPGLRTAVLERISHRDIREEVVSERLRLFGEATERAFA